jgi:hypothetical protein
MIRIFCLEENGQFCEKMEEREIKPFQEEFLNGISHNFFNLLT